MQQIKNIIFDLGGIFLDIDYPKTEKAFINLGITNFPELYNQHHASDLFELLETGKITPTEFYNQFASLSPVVVTDKQIQEAWNAMLGTFPLERIEWLKQIKNRYNIFLFSNTNKIHHDAFTLFIDDTFTNIEGAKEAGMQTIHLVAPRTVLDLDL